MVETADFANLALFNLIQPTDNDWSTLFSIENPFLGYPTCLLSALVVWWSTSLWTARTTRRRRPGRSLALGCITSVGVSSTRMWYAVVMVVDMKVHESFNMFDKIKYMWAGGRRHCGRQGQHGEGNQEGQWQIGCITSVGIFTTWCDMLRRLWLTCKFFLYFQHVWQH